MGKYLKILACISLATLSACTQIKRDQTSVGFHSYESPDGYMINIPIGYKYSELSPSKKYYYFGYPNTSQTGLRTIEFHNIETHENCSNELLGTNHIQNLESVSSNVIWGRVDILEETDSEGFDRFNELSKIKCQKSGLDKNESVYAMCSGKNKKTVVVCMIQKPDNPQLAEEIFKTFKWTK